LARYFRSPEILKTNLGDDSPGEDALARRDPPVRENR